MLFMAESAEYGLSSHHMPHLFFGLLGRFPCPGLLQKINYIIVCWPFNYVAVWTFRVQLLCSGFFARIAIAVCNYLSIFFWGLAIVLFCWFPFSEKINYIYVRFHLVTCSAWPFPLLVSLIYTIYFTLSSKFIMVSPCFSIIYYVLLVSNSEGSCRVL